MCLADLASNKNKKKKMDAAYKDPIKWNQMSLKNIAEAGRFSADRAVREYATKIWRM